MIVAKGLGEYPGYYCYDADRPSWLPYWLDDLTESACKWNPKTIAGNIYSCVTGSPNCGTPSGTQLDPGVSGAGVAAPGQPVNVTQCGMFQVLDPTTNTCTFGVDTTLLATIGIGLVGIFFVSTVIGGGGPRRYGR